jgi:Predicted membrane protein (DUF2207).
MLFQSENDILVLKKINAAKISAARNVHKQSLEREYVPVYFRRNGKQAAIAWLIAIVVGIAAFIAAQGFGIVALVAVEIITLVSLIVFGRLVRAPTSEGRELLDEIEGFKLYMSVAERDELKSLRSPDAPPVLDAERYEAMLPYAVALEVEDAWTQKFTAAAGAAAVQQAQQGMGWYRGAARSPISAASATRSAPG